MKTLKHFLLATTVVLALTAALSAQTSTRQAPAPAASDEPTDIKEGRRLYQQKCAFCHVRATRVARTYGPGVSAAQVTGREVQVKEIISRGSVRMPGFGITLTPQQIDAIIAFLKTLDSPPDRIVVNTPQF